MPVNLYKIDELQVVQGLYVKRALDKMDGNLDVYSTLLDKFLNAFPRSVPKLRKAAKEQSAADLRRELKDLRIDLADIFALDMLSRAGLLFEAAEKGDVARVSAVMDAFISALQNLSQEIKACRTQEMIENAEQAAHIAAELDIGSGVVNNRFATIPKGKFVELYKRISSGRLDKAANLTNVLKAMGYGAELNSIIEQIGHYLLEYKYKNALETITRLLGQMAVKAPPAAAFRVLVLDNGDAVAEGVRGALGESVSALSAGSADTAMRAMRGGFEPKFTLVNYKMSNAAYTAELIGREIPDTPMGFVFTSPTPQDIMAARKMGAAEYFTLPLDAAAFAEKMKKYINLV